MLLRAIHAPAYIPVIYGFAYGLSEKCVQTSDLRASEMRDNQCGRDLNPLHVPGASYRLAKPAFPISLGLRPH